MVFNCFLVKHMIFYLFRISLHRVKRGDLSVYPRIYYLRQLSGFFLILIVTSTLKVDLVWCISVSYIVSLA